MHSASKVSKRLESCKNEFGTLLFHCVVLSDNNKEPIFTIINAEIESGQAWGYLVKASASKGKFISNTHDKLA